MARSKQSGGATDDSETDPGPTVGEVCIVFLRHAEQHYRKNGRPTSQLQLCKNTIRPLNELFGLTPAKDFGPLCLKAVRAKMIEMGWCRETVNHSIGRIRRFFKFAVENELVEPSVLQKLQAVAPLLAGRTEAHDNAPRTAVSDADIEAVKPHVSPKVRDLIDLQRLTGARSGELLGLTTGDIDRSGDVWTAELSDHKCLHHGQTRTLCFGPKSQLILRKYLSADPAEALFKITRNCFRRQITLACEEAGIERWTPHQLRHTTASIVREQFGLEHTQSVLGHSKANMSERYAQAGTQKAIEVARRIG